MLSEAREKRERKKTYCARIMYISFIWDKKSFPFFFLLPPPFFFVCFLFLNPSSWERERFKDYICARAAFSLSLSFLTFRDMGRQLGSLWLFGAFVFSIFFFFFFFFVIFFFFLWTLCFLRVHKYDRIGVYNGGGKVSDTFEMINIYCYRCILCECEDMFFFGYFMGTFNSAIWSWRRGNECWNFFSSSSFSLIFRFKYVCARQRHASNNKFS